MKVTFNSFKKTIWMCYEKNGRHNLPWRNTHNPYAILVSEVMLQQTQVERVRVFYDRFLKKFPDFASLAGASIKEVLQIWKGLGYNRRGLNLQKTSQIVVNKYKGVLPSTEKELDDLPGIGKGTAGSFIAFVYNKPVVFIETNIRRVFIHFFFSDKESISDKEIFPFIEKTIDKDNPREWYYALMDYGSMIKKEMVNPNRRSKHYTKQKPFKGSNREIRSFILQHLLEGEKTHQELHAYKMCDEEKLEYNLETLEKEGFIMEGKGVYEINETFT